MDFVIKNSWLIPILPLIGAAVAGFFGARWLRGQSHWPIWIGVGASAVLAITLLSGMLGRAHHEGKAESGRAEARAEGESTVASGKWIGERKDYFTWIQAGDPSGPFDAKSGKPPESFTITAGFWFDPLTAVMLAFVLVVGFFITVFSAGYMKGEEGYFRFFAFLGLFIFMMTTLVMGNNLIMLYLGWEGVGLCSYLLIGYYYERPAARDAATKAFIVNRIGDFGFALGIMLSFLAFGTISFFGHGIGTNTGLLELAANGQLHGGLTEFQQNALRWIPFLLMLGAFGKSAQFPLYVWLPDAMEGPTPVSALIHAATMVTAGVYMIARCGTLFVGNPGAMATVAAVGGFTALLAATIALRQWDLKKVFAYSTISQLGFMFVGVGVLAPVAGVFHMVTHAFFKALLFLSSGVVMHAMGGVLDMRQMSGIKRVLPKTNILMLIGCLALAGFPFLSGFFSKDEIIGGIFFPLSFWRFVLGIVMLFTAFLTAFYTFRLYFQVFQGPLVLPEAPAAGAHGPAHSPEDAHATASASAVQAGDVAESGVDTHLAKDAAHHGGAVHGHGHGHDDHHDHEPWIMILPLVVLALGAVVAGYFNYPKELLGEFLGKSPSFGLSYDIANVAYGHVDPARFGQGEAEHSAIPMMILSAVIACAGIWFAYVLHLRDRMRAERLAERLEPLTGWIEAKYWVDEFYQAAVVEPLRQLGRIFFAVDRILVDGIVTALSWIPQLFGWSLRLTVQRGSLQGYASAMLFGIVIILLLVFTMGR
jgi:NADH-quinone oxidoreductase subunit L